MTRTLLLLAACLAAAHCIKNIDLQQPIVRTAPEELNKDGYFGYSLVLHQKVVSTGFEQSLQNTYLIVGAPNGTRSNSAEKNTGFVYECRLAQNGQCTRIPALSDDTADSNLEDKEGQFMGGALASNGDRFMACGHRYVNFNPSNTNTRSVYGRCFYADRSLNNFQEFQPCEGVGRKITQSLGVCPAGMSAVVAETSDGTDHLALGAPGSYLLKRIVIRSTPGRVDSNRFQPYDLTGEKHIRVGKETVSLRASFRSTNVEDFATSVPRLGSYFGAVHIIRNDDTLQMISQNLVGDQMGEYYGFSLVALNLAGDSLDELIVSAPMYRDRNIGAETGRIYIYRNIGATLSLVTRIVGVAAYSRFGHAMASLGDITGDGFDDVAVSAPFGAEQGTVYIYHSSASQFLTPTPQQVITPSTLNLMPIIISEFESFGTALASFDVDGNGFNDLAIGSYKDQSAVVLRTRPLAQVTTTLVATPGIVDITDANQMMAYDVGTFSYFDVIYSVEFNGQGSITLDITLVSERARRNQGLQQRLFFRDTSDTAQREPMVTRQDVQLNQGQEQTFTDRVFVQNGILDIFSGFTFDLEITARDFVRPENNGNERLTNLDAFPVVSISGPSSLQVEIQNNCTGECIADLAVTRNGDVTYTGARDPNLLTVGEVTEVIIPISIQNKGNNAFRAQLVFNLPIQSLLFTSVSGEFITCNQGNGNGQIVPFICDIGNPFEMDVTQSTEFRFRPADSLTGERQHYLNFNVTSSNEGNLTNDNTVGVTLQVNTVADIFVDEGIAFPDQVNHASEPPTGDIVNVTSLGPSFVTTFTIGNNGPSVIPNARLTIHWPLNVKDSENKNYFLYLTGWRTIQSTSVSVSCDTTYFNPAGLDIATSVDTAGTPGGIPGTSEGRRRRRSVGGGMQPRRRRGRNTRIPRQDMENLPVSVDRRVSCLPEDRDNIANNHTCAAIVCEVRQLRAGNRVQVEISAVIDERHIAGIDSYTFFPSAQVEMVGSDHINESNTKDNNASAEFRSIPGELVVPSGSSGDDESVPWYVIAVPIIAAVILIIVVAVVLYFCGFFRRKNKQEIEDQARENLAEENTAM
uniref:Integrin n=1 Tax=Geodia cydonium TaxID=6047 RepID=O18428_GEOCY|nr:integrin [Geodia cydonium]